MQRTAGCRACACSAASARPTAQPSFRPPPCFPPFAQVFWAGCAAGVVQTAIIVPVDLLKIRLQLQVATRGAPGYVGPLALLRSVLRAEGLPGAPRGGQGGRGGSQGGPASLALHAARQPAWTARPFLYRPALQACTAAPLSPASETSPRTESILVFMRPTGEWQRRYAMQRVPGWWPVRAALERHCRALLCCAVQGR